MDFNKHLKSYLTDKEIEKLNSSIHEDNLKAVLLNTRKMDSETFLELFPNVTPHPIVPNAFIYDPSIYPLGKSIYHNLGCFYIQEPSAMVPAYILNANENDIVLDLCAAPGGKSIQTSFLMNNKGLIISNDISRSRASIILENIERLGIGNVLITNNDFSKIYKRYKNTFTKIILDAPCSGSGMFKKDQKMIDDWSYNKVLKFQEIQKELILMCYEMLQDGGEMVYSTCSFSKEEDEDVIKHLLENTNAILADINYHPTYFINSIGIHLLPHIFPGDGHYICKVKKPGEIKQQKLKIIQENNILKNLFLDTIIGEKTIKNYNNVFFALPNNNLNFDNFNIVRFGLKLGEIKGKDFIFDFHLSRCLSSYINEVELYEDEVQKYIKGETISRKIKKGFVLIKFKNIPISFGKSDGEIIKNHYPKHLRH